MKKSIIILLIAIGFSASGQGQNTIQSIKDFQEFMNSSGEFRYQQEGDNNIQGTPYLDTLFKSGMIRYNGTWYGDIQLRFDVFNNAMQAKLKDGIIVLDPLKNPVDSLILGQELFVKRELQGSKKTDMHYLVDLESVEDYSLLKRYNIDFKPATQATAYGSAKPAKYVSVSSDYFIGKGDQTYLIKGFETFAELFNMDKKQVKKLAKSNSLKLKNEADLATLLNLLVKK